MQVSAAAPALGRLQLQEDGGHADPRNTTLLSAEPNKQYGQTRRVGHVNSTFWLLREEPKRGERADKQRAPDADDQRRV